MHLYTRYFTGIEGHSGVAMCQGGEPDTGEFYMYECVLLHALVKWVHGQWHVCYGSRFSNIFLLWYRVVNRLEKP